MNWYRKNPLFAAALTLCALLVLGEGWLIYDRFAASRSAAKKLVQRESELMAMKDLAPVPTRPVATAIEGDLARAQRAVAAMQAELKGRGPAAERLATAKVPAARTEACRCRSCGTKARDTGSANSLSGKKCCRAAGEV